VQIIVNHLTRMKTHSRICIAGIDAATFQAVRPVTPATDLLTRRLLRENDGPFGVGALVDIGPVTACPNPPETEDHTFATENTQHVEDLEDDVYLQLLEDISDTSIPAAFGPELVDVRDGKYAVAEGAGSRSLAVVPLVTPQLEIDGWGNLYLNLEPRDMQARIRVSDVRFYEPDHVTVRRDVVEDVSARIAAGVQVRAMLGLARPVSDAQAGRVQWLMVNGLCLADRAVSDIP
jgi:hypothetical protein